MFLDNLFTVLRILAPLFLLILLGAVLKRKNVIPAAAIPVLNGLVVYVTFPALIILALAKAPELPLDYAKATFCFFAATMSTMLLAYLIGLACRLPRTIRGALLMTASFGNSGFLGYPITLARPLVAGLFPAAVLLDQFGMTLPMYLSVVLISGLFSGVSETHPGAGLHKNPGTIKSILRFFRGPVFISIVLGLMARLIPWPAALLEISPLKILGQIIGQTCTYLGQGTTPIVLLAFGAALRTGAIRRFPIPVFSLLRSKTDRDSPACLGLLPSDRPTTRPYFAFRTDECHANRRYVLCTLHSEFAGGRYGRRYRLCFYGAFGNYGASSSILVALILNL